MSPLQMQCVDTTYIHHWHYLTFINNFFSTLLTTHSPLSHSLFFSPLGGEEMSGEYGCSLHSWVISTALLKVDQDR
jgi:hypothetical protein